MSRLSGGGGSDDESSSDAEEELSRRDRGGGGNTDIPDSVYDDIDGASGDTSDDGGGGGSGSSEADAADELERRDPGSDDGGDGGGSGGDSGGNGAEEELERRDRGSGDGGGDSSGSDGTREDAAEELTERDQGSTENTKDSGDSEPRSRDPGVTSGDGETARRAPEGSSTQESRQERQAAAEEELTERDQGSASEPDPARPVSPGRTEGAVTSGAADTDPEDLSVLAEMSVPADRRSEAIAGEGRIQARAQQGETFAELSQAGVERQEFGQRRASDAEAAAELFLDSPARVAVDPIGAATGGRYSPLEAEVGSESATVEEQFVSFAGGAVAFPSTIAGGTAQAAGAAGLTAQDALEGGEIEADFDDVKQTTATAAGQQASLVTERPVEAALIAAPVVAGGRPSVPRRVSSGASRARGGARQFLADESGQAQIGGRRSRSEGSSSSTRQVEPSSRRSSPDLDPRVFERNRGRGGGRRSQGIDAEIGSRPGRSGGGGEFRQNVQRFKEIEGAPTRDLRASAEAPPASSPGRQVGSGEGAVSASGAVDSSRQEGVELLEEAQQQQVTQEDEMFAQSEEQLDVTIAEETTGTSQIQEQATQPDVDASKVTDIIDSSTRGQDTDIGGAGSRPSESPTRNRPGPTRSQNRERTTTDTTPATDQTPGQETGQDRRTNVPPETTPTGRTTPTTPPGEPTTTSRGGNRPPRRLPPMPDMPSGGESQFTPREATELFDREFENPVASPDELDDVAGDILNDIDDTRRRRRRDDDLVAFDDDLGDLDDALEGL